MKTKLTVILLAIFLIIPTVVFSAPTPASYDDPAWENLIEKGIGTLPDSEPLGQGAVSGFNGESYWPRGFLQIHKPFDLKNHEGLVFSQHALDYGKHYASETVKLFLEATLEALGKIDPSNKPLIPIQSLFYAPTESVPMSNLSEETLAVNLGIFILKGDKSEPLPFALISESGVTKGTDIQLKFIQNAYEQYRRYADGMRPHLNMLKSLPPSDMRQQINELKKDIREAAKLEKQAQKENKPKSKATKTPKGNTSNPKAKKNPKDSLPLPDLNAARTPRTDPKVAAIENRYHLKQKALYAQLAEASGPERMNLAEQYVSLELEMEKEIEALKLSQNPSLATAIQEELDFYDDIDSKIRTAIFDALTCETSCQKTFAQIDDLEAERNQMHATRISVLRKQSRQPEADKKAFAQYIQFHEIRRKMHEKSMVFNRETLHMPKANQSDSENGRLDQYEKIDIPRTWAMFEAMLTQTTIPIADIIMPTSIKDELKYYATSTHRPANIIAKFDQIVLGNAHPKIDLTNAFTVHLMCSARDRLLGCKIGGDPETEAKVSDVVSRILKLTESSARNTQFRALEYAVRANPVDLTFKLDTKKLKEATNSMLGETRKKTYQSLLRDFNKIPLRGDSVSNSRSSRLREKSKTQDNNDLDI